jgi:putative transposase
MRIFHVLFRLLRLAVSSHAALAAENLALRQQIIVLQRSVKRPHLKKSDRVFWAWLSKLWPDWSSALVIVQPDTVVKWHRAGFRLYWRWKSHTTGRPKKEIIVRELIRQMSCDNPTWGAPRIRAELRLLGHHVAESTVASYMVKSRKLPSPTWRSFLANHASQIVAIDFFTVYTITFKVLYGFVGLSHDRRRIVHFNVTRNPTAEWTAQQIIEAFPYDTAPRFLLHDRDSVYGAAFHRRVKSMGIEEVTTAYRSPWQNPYCERVIGSIRRDCLWGAE